jgi:hypothetical protein
LCPHPPEKKRETRKRDEREIDKEEETEKERREKPNLSPVVPPDPHLLGNVGRPASLHRALKSRPSLA